MGRKSKTDIVLKNLDVIKQLKSQGATDLQIAKHIGVCPATWYKVLKADPELQKIMNDAKADLVTDLVGELTKKAKSHQLKTTKTITKGSEVITEVTVKDVDGDLGALIFLLKNYAPDKWSNDWKALELKQRELELKEKALEKDLW